MITRARPLSALRRGLLVAAALLTIPVAGLYAQTTGRLFGQLTDAQGASLPGVTVSVSSPSMQGTQTQVTDGEGNYRFPSLPPGHYTVKAELASFKTIEQPVDVGLDRTVTLESQDVARRRHRIGHGPGDVADGRHDLDDHGRQRHARKCSTSFRCAATSTRLTTMAPGVTSDMVGPIVYGSSSAENQYIIDGLNTTGVELGDKGKTLNYDFVQEVEVKTGGLPAEYGRMTGGVVNVLTKSGGNQFSGSVFGFGEGGAAAGQQQHRGQAAGDDHAVTDIAHQADVGGRAGRIHRSRIASGSSAPTTASTRVDDTTVIRTISLAGSAGDRLASVPLDDQPRSVRGEADRQGRLGPHVQLQRERRSVEARRQRLHDLRSAEHVRRRA